MQIKKSSFVFAFRDHSIEDSDFPGERGVGAGGGGGGEAICVDFIILESTSRCGVTSQA